MLSLDSADLGVIDQDWLGAALVQRQVRAPRPGTITA